MTISIVLVSYNQEEYIYDALNAILTQTLQPDQVIIADDCSKDKTQKIISEFIKDNALDGKWFILFNKENMGITGNCKNAFNYVTSDIVILMAGDDISMENRCYDTAKLFKEHPNQYMIAGSVFKIDSNNNIIGDISFKDCLCDDIISVIKNGTPNVFPVGSSFKRELFNIFGTLPTDVPNEDDQIIFWGLVSNGIYCSSKYVAKYRIHQDSASAWLRNRQSDAEFFSRFIEDMPIRRRHMELWKKSIQCINREDSAILYVLLDKKIELYSFLENIICYSFCKRLCFLWSHYSVTGLREKYYILGGKFGILSWRWVKKILGKI